MESFVTFKRRFVLPWLTFHYHKYIRRTTARHSETGCERQSYGVRTFAYKCRNGATTSSDSL